MVAINYRWRKNFRSMQRILFSTSRRIRLCEILIILFFCWAILFSLPGCGGDDLVDSDNDDVSQNKVPIVVTQNRLTIETAVLDLTERLGVSTSEQSSVLHMFMAMGIPYIETGSVAIACNYPLIVLVNAIGAGDLSIDEKTELADYVAGGGD